MDTQAPVTLPPPTLDLGPTSLTKWDEEQRAFLRLLPDLLRTSRGQYVAVHQGRVIETGPDKLGVLMRAYGQCGYVPVYVGLVEERPLPPERFPHYRVVGG